MKTRIYLFSFLAVLATTLRCAALEAGDVMVVGYISDGTDSVAFVPWVEIAAGETITIIDARYLGGGSGAETHAASAKSWAGGWTDDRGRSGDRPFNYGRRADCGCVRKGMPALNLQGGRRGRRPGKGEGNGGSARRRSAKVAG